MVNMLVENHAFFDTGEWHCFCFWDFWVCLCAVSYSVDRQNAATVDMANMKNI